MNQTDVKSAMETASTYLTVYGMRLLAALAIFVIGKWTAKVLARVLDGSMQRARVESTLATFIRNLVYCSLLIMSGAITVGVTKPAA